jgi:hypothetical protein
MQMHVRTFQRPWRKVKTPTGYVIIDNEGKRLGHVPASASPASFADLSFPEAEAVAEAIADMPRLLDLQSVRQAPAAPLEPLIALTQARDGKWYIVRDSYGVLISSRAFETREAATYACVVWYGCEPAMPAEEAPEVEEPEWEEPCDPESEEPEWENPGDFEIETREIPCDSEQE